MIAENTPHPYGLPNLWLSQRDQPGFAAVDGDGLGMVAEALMGPSSICTMNRRVGRRLGTAGRPYRGAGHAAAASPLLFSAFV